jgi:hypothetical protein
VKTVRILSLAAALVCSGPLDAQVCSGGRDGGTDATGNQCNQPLDPVDQGLSPGASALRPGTRPADSQRAEPMPSDVGPAATRSSASAQAARERGLREYDAGHFEIAATHLLLAAELGDPRSAEMLALMYRYGEQLYGNAFHADQASAQRWLSVAIALRRTDRLVAAFPSR